MKLNEQFEELFNNIPLQSTRNLTFMEIAGYPHYENVASNILKFFFTPNKELGQLNNFLLSAFITAVGNVNGIAFNENTKILVKREVVTLTGRIDLVIYLPDWIIVIENKIKHHLNNDLKEYAKFIESKHSHSKILKVVLSLKEEGNNLQGSFINLTYSKFIETIESLLQPIDFKKSDQSYATLFYQFIQTIKNLYMPIVMEKEELHFLINNSEKISEVIKLNTKMDNYIDQRARKIMHAINIPHISGKWVYEGYDVGFHYLHNDVKYKVECLITRFGISILICVEINKIVWEELNKLDFFRIKKSEEYTAVIENERVVIEDNIDFFIKDEELIKKLETILNQVKVSD